jgi:antitoxin VapB
MSMNIKNPETFRLAKELAAATGESMTAAVTTAIRERLERVRADFDTHEILEMAREIRERLPPGYLDQDFDELLYDEHGLPK